MDPSLQYSLNYYIQKFDLAENEVYKKKDFDMKNGKEIYVNVSDIPKKSHIKITEKTCGKCRVTKRATEFYTNTQSRDGHYTNCKLCMKNE